MLLSLVLVDLGRKRSGSSCGVLNPVPAASILIRWLKWKKKKGVLKNTVEKCHNLIVADVQYAEQK